MPTTPMIEGIPNWLSVPLIVLGVIVGWLVLDSIFRQFKK